VYNPEKDEMEQLPEEERQESLFDDPQEEMAAMDDQLSCKHSKMRIHFRPIDIDQLSRLLREKQGSPEINMVQMRRT
jgi:hypothetical protein